MLPRAESDFGSILAYIEQRSGTGARSWRDAFESRVALLAQQPLSGGQAAEDELAEIEIREVFFKTHHGLPYRIVYTFLGDEILILRIRGPGQPPLAKDEFPPA